MEARQRVLYQIVVVIAAALVTSAIAVVITIIVIRNDQDTPAAVSEAPPGTTTDSGGLDYQRVLREYCETPDPTYSYQTLPEFTNVDHATNTTTILLNITSQAWSTRK